VTEPFDIAQDIRVDDSGYSVSAMLPGRRYEQVEVFLGADYVGVV